MLQLIIILTLVASVCFALGVGFGGMLGSTKVDRAYAYADKVARERNVLAAENDGLWTTINRLFRENQTELEPIDTVWDQLTEGTVHSGTTEGQLFLIKGEN